MKTGNLNEIVNKGIPTSQTILISLRDLINLSRNKNRADQAAYSIWAKHITDLETIIGTPIPFSLFESLCVVIDEKTLEKKIIFSPNCAISGVAVNLNLFKYFGNGFLSNPNSSLSILFNTPMLGNMNYFISLILSAGTMAILLAITYTVFRRRDY